MFNLAKIAAATPAEKSRELTAREIIPHEALRRLSGFCPQRILGRLTDEDAAVMVMILPDMCDEMRALRTALNRSENSFSIPSAELRKLAQHSAARERGELTRREHLILCARLPRMCRELITLRSLIVAEAA